MGQYLYRRWLLPEDHIEDDAVLSGKCTRVPSDPGERPGGIALRLWQLAVSAKLSVMARLSSSGSSRYDDPGEPAGEIVRKYLEKLQGDPKKLHLKWRYGTLLISDPGWFWEAENTASWATARKLRDSTQRSGGYLTLRDMWGMASQLDDAQLDSLREIFPAARIAMKYRELLLLCGRDSARLDALSSESGIPCRPDILELLGRDSAIRYHLEVYGPTSVRFHSFDSENDSGKRREFRLQLLDRQGVWRSVIGWFDVPYKHPSELLESG
jgi:hypothetical protein